MILWHLEHWSIFSLSGMLIIFKVAKNFEMELSALYNIFNEPFQYDHEVSFQVTESYRDQGKLNPALKITLELIIYFPASNISRERRNILSHPWRPSNRSGSRESPNCGKKWKSRVQKVHSLFRVFYQDCTEAGLFATKTFKVLDIPR